MQTHYVDVVFCHRPDPTTPLEETVRALNRLIDRGMALYWGTSEWRVEEIMRAETIAQRLGLIGPIVEQPLYNLFNRQRVESEYTTLYSSLGLGLTVYSPLAEGILAGRYSSGVAPAGSRAATVDRKKDLASRTGQIEAARELEPLAKEAGCTLSQLVLAWTLRDEHVSTAIMGASNPQQIVDNVGAVHCLQKVGADMFRRMEDIASAKVILNPMDQQTVSRLTDVGRGPYA